MRVRSMSSSSLAHFSSGTGKYASYALLLCMHSNDSLSQTATVIWPYFFLQRECGIGIISSASQVEDAGHSLACSITISLPSQLERPGTSAYLLEKFSTNFSTNFSTFFFKFYKFSSFQKFSTIFSIFLQNYFRENFRKIRKIVENFRKWRKFSKK